MGIWSSKVQNDSKEESKKKKSGDLKSMTTSIRKSLKKDPASVKIEPANTLWRQKSTRHDFEKKSFIEIKSDDRLELMRILSDPLGQKYIGNFARKIYTTESFFCWVDIHEFIGAPSSGYRKCLAQHIYAKYIRCGASMSINGLTTASIENYKQKIESAQENLQEFTIDFFKDLTKICFDLIFENTYELFKKTKEYAEYKKVFRDTYNKVTVDDFDYFDILGQGGFGRVIHARKKSTNQHYAMKIQLKAGMLDEHRKDLSQINLEKTIYEACNNPYIVDMHYSFQTPEYAIIVLALARGGDLHGLLKSTNNTGLPEDQVRLYAAEIILALHQLHEMGIIYRDLKPGNVLLDHDGHVRLADMGLAGGLDIVGDNEESADKLSEIAKSHEIRLSNSININSETSRLALPGGYLSTPPLAHQVRRKTTVGTRGYMAPEILKGKYQKRAERSGYNQSVDYWALGITLFELICGYQPFSKEYIQHLADGDYFRIPENRDQIGQYLSVVDFPEFVSPEARSFIERLLDVNEQTRIGCTINGILEIMQHVFFKEIDWDKLTVKHVEATYKPKLIPLPNKPKYSSFQHMMDSFPIRSQDSLYTWKEIPEEKYQVYYESWDFISPQTLKAELGIAKEMDISNMPYKVLQLTGKVPKKTKK